MLIPDELRKTVGFIAFENKANGQIVPVGSCFFLGRDPPAGSTTSQKVYLVTAKHVIDQLRKRGVQEVIVRLNPKLANAPLITDRIPIDTWFSHPTDTSIDVAIIEKGIPATADHLLFPLSLCLTAAHRQNNEVALGDDIFISGLFAHHFGTKRNIPIIRTGTLAALDDEKIDVDDFGEIEGFLVEARSTGGISGSPTFLNLGVVRVVGGELKFSADNKPVIFLLGLVHGHFIVRGKHTTSRTDEINAGIAVVVSASSIISVINQYDAQHP